jgi:hypothetical protein
VAAVRTGRHFAGYDTDPAYAAAAMERVGHERRAEQVQLPAKAPREGDPLVLGAAARDLARARLVDAGFREVADGERVVTGVEPTLQAVDARGRRWLFEVVGGRTTNRPGAQRIELLWRAIAKGAVVRAAEPTHHYAVLTCAVPTAASGGRALEIVTGPDQPVQAVIDLLAEDSLDELIAIGSL